MKHTKTPWAWIPAISENHHPAVTKKKGRGVIALAVTENMEQANEDAMHIVKCVNAYDELKAKADMFDELVDRLDECREFMWDAPLNRDVLNEREYNDLIADIIGTLKKAKELTDND